jgi:3-phenylpropionate/trans-cinnamate dioxygenase ferredoxin subunit
MTRHVVAAVADFPPGTRRLVTIKGRPIALFNIEGSYYGLFNRCPHQAGSLYHGLLTGLPRSTSPGEYSLERCGEILRCPWHGWEFDVRTGQSYCDPARVKVRNFQVEVRDGRQVVEGPYVAETVPVTVEQDYVVVEV